MWFYLVIGAIIVLSLIGLAAVVARRFPQLTLIDADSLPQEREAQKKKQILRERVARRTVAKGLWLRRRLGPAFVFLGRRFQAMLEAVTRLDKKFWAKATGFVHPAERQRQAMKLVAAADRLLEQDKPTEAEKKYIEAISMDGKCWAAYRGLGELYMETKNYSQARETYDFLARMMCRPCCGRGKRRQTHIASPAVKAEIAKDHVSLALACRAFGDNDGWRRALEVAVLHEPANPRHLDLLLEACIMDGDKPRATAVLELLREVNPDNNKLADLERKVAAIPVPLPEMAEQA